MTQSTQNLAVLVTSVGNKVELLRIWQQVLRRNHGFLIGVDSNPNALARCECDLFLEMPATNSKGFWPAIQEIIKKHNVRLIVPIKSEDLLPWAQFKESNPSFFKNIHLAASSRECLEVTLDKRNTHAWLKRHGFPTPFTVEVSALKPREKLSGQLILPCLAKDPLGSSFREIKTINFKSEIFELPSHWILQPHLQGQEFTLNAYVNREGKCICLIPHLREKAQDGQVCQATTLKNGTLIKLGQEVAEALPQAYGPISIQVIWDMDQQHSPYIIDINPRFGGGYPLAHRAGGSYVNWLIKEATGSGVQEQVCSWEEGIQFQRIGRQAYFTRSPFKTLVEVRK